MATLTAAKWILAILTLFLVLFILILIAMVLIIVFRIKRLKDMDRWAFCLFTSLFIYFMDGIAFSAIVLFGALGMIELSVCVFTYTQNSFYIFLCIFYHFASYSNTKPLYSESYHERGLKHILFPAFHLFVIVGYTFYVVRSIIIEKCDDDQDQLVNFVINAYFTLYTLLKWIDFLYGRKYLGVIVKSDKDSAHTAYRKKLILGNITRSKLVLFTLPVINGIEYVSIGLKVQTGILFSYVDITIIFFSICVSCMLVRKMIWRVAWKILTCQNVKQSDTQPPISKNASSQLHTKFDFQQNDKDVVPNESEDDEDVDEERPNKKKGIFTNFDFEDNKEEELPSESDDDDLAGGDEKKGNEDKDEVPNKPGLDIDTDAANIPSSQPVPGSLTNPTADLSDTPKLPDPTNDPPLTLEPSTHSVFNADDETAPEAQPVTTSPAIEKEKGNQEESKSENIGDVGNEDVTTSITTVTNVIDDERDALDSDTDRGGVKSIENKSIKETTDT